MNASGFRVMSLGRVLRSGLGPYPRYMSSALVKAKDETIIYNVDPVVPTTYIEKSPFPVRIKEHAKV